jgi:hypothetical protein
MEGTRWVLVLAVAATLLPVGTAAQARSEGRAAAADRELARDLSAALVLVGEEGGKFADARDALARSRLRNMQRLEDSTVRLRESNDLDIGAWRVIGEDYRLRLFQGIVDATEEIAHQKAAAAERRTQQEQDLASAASAVEVRTSELTAAASSLAALGEAPASSEALATLVRGTLSQLSASLGEEDGKLKQGLDLADALLSQLANPAPDHAAENGP